MRKLDVMTVVGLILGAATIVVAIYLGGSMELFWSLPSVLITVGGSIAGLMISYSLPQIKAVVAITRQTIFSQTTDPLELVDFFAELARKARREGLLGLEEDIYRMDDAFFQKGLRMMVDAIDPQVIRGILETDIDYTAQRHELGQKVFRTWASLAPAFGMIGTLVGLIQMLANLDDPSALGPGMAVALLTTFYGSIMANLVFIPLSTKLGLRSQEEEMIKEIMMEGIISIQSGLNPRILEEKLRSFLPSSIAKQGQAEEGMESAL